ncbi:zinc-binding dehydrogenase [Ideonella sp.]|uniref:zinc-binding dehydrogenase n=1 Tax=Ideonella sp. TaxID=1929293 RepID=UPI002B47C297|nr:zinc-binding dehydrogenase [Ideonella sp.]HJV69615.1 zinc-binding dehydrogenase [Ideonella sp.]
MQSVVIDRFGEPADVVHAAERPLPTPGPGEARVRMLLSPIHNHDLAIVRGVYGYKPALPAVPGTEALGVVEALGEGVQGLRVGQRVATASAQAAWAECFVSPAAKLVPVPDALPDEAACQLLAMPLSALMLLEDMKLQPGQWIVQNAANGAVGKVLAALAAARGIGVVNLVRRESALADLAAAGIAHGVSTDTTGWQDRAKAAAGGAPIVRAIDSIGGESAQQVMTLLAENGELISFGSLTFKPLLIGADQLIFKQAVVRGYWASKRLAATPPAELARMIGELARLAAGGVLKLPVGGVFGLDEAPAAMAAAEHVGRSGKVLLRGSR